MIQNGMVYKRLRRISSILASVFLVGAVASLWIFSTLKIELVVLIILWVSLLLSFIIVELKGNGGDKNKMQGVLHKSLEICEKCDRM